MLLLVVLVMATVVMAYPPGAPIQACKDGTNIIPISVDNMATGEVSFTVDISNIGSRYTPGDNYTSKWLHDYIVCIHSAVKL